MKPASKKPLCHIHLRRLPSGDYVATVIVPGHDAAQSAVSATARGKTKAAALTRAGTIAERIASDPVLSAIMPPQARVAINVARKLGAAAKLGGPTLRRLWGSTKGPGKARLVEALAKA